jgi:membrane protease YdiL (CAAX protease family)
MSHQIPPLRSVLPTVAAALAIEFVLGLFRPAQGAPALHGVAGLLVVAIEVLAFGLPPLVAIRLTRSDWRHSLRWGCPSWRFLPPVLVGAPALSVLLLYVQTYWGHWWSNYLPMSSGPSLGEALQAESSLQVAGLVLLVGVVPAITEELFFRGFFMRVLEHHWRPATAVAVATGLFALLHFDVYGLPTYIVLGIWFGVLAQRSGSLLFPVLAHLLHNGLDVVGRNLLAAETFELHAAWLPYAALVGTLSAVAWLEWQSERDTPS